MRKLPFLLSIVLLFCFSSVNAGQPPLVNFAGSPTAVIVGGQVTFADLSANSPTSWSWSFPGGTPSTSTEQNPVITYDSPGLYDVTLTATNASGSATLTQSAYISVTLPVPVCDTPTNFLAGQKYSNTGFLGSADGLVLGMAEHYTANQYQTSISGVLIDYAQVPSYYEDSVQITVSVWDTTGTGGGPGKVLGSLSWEVYASHTPYEYRYNFTKPITVSGAYFIGLQWGTSVPSRDTFAVYTSSFSENSYNTTWIEESNQTWTTGYDYTGYNINAAIFPIICNPANGTITTANFSFTPTTTVVGGNVSFTDQSTANPIQWRWSFPGGTPSSSTLQNPTITYDTVGSYNVTLYATNNYGSDSLLKAESVTVVAPPEYYCDTFSNTTGDKLTAYPFLDTVEEVAESFTAPAGGYTLNTVLIYFSEAILGNDYNEPFVYVTVYDASGPGGSPGNQITSIFYSIEDVSTTGVTVFDFPEPVTISGHFYIAISGNPSNGEKFEIYTNTIGESVVNTGWFYDNGWLPFTKSTSVGGNGLANAIYPLFCAKITTAPTANFTGTPTSIVPGGGANFTDLSTGDPTSWQWTFSGGNPSSSTEENPTVYYYTPGTYSVTLTATNYLGSNSITKTGYITVTDESVPCDTLGNVGGGTNVISYNEPITGIGAISGNNGIGITEIAEKIAVPHPGLAVTAVQIDFAKALYKGPTDIVNVHVWDATGPNGGPGNLLSTEPLLISGIKTNPIYVYPTLVPLSNTPIIYGDTFYVGVEPTYSPGDTISVFTTYFSIQTRDPGTGWVYTPDSGWHTYYDLYDSVSGGYGALDNAMYAVYCVPALPDPNFSGTPVNINIGGTVNFTDLSTNNPTSWSWSFPGGTPSTSTAQNPTGIIYSTPGSYNVTLTASNNFGSNSITKTAYITVANGTTPAPVANFSGSPTTLTAGGSVNFTDLSTNSPTSWSWSFPGGNPSTSTSQNPTGITYSTAGTYNVTLTATNAGGSNTATKTAYITVTTSTQIAPVANFSGTPTTVTAGGSVNFTDLSTNTPTSWSWSFAGGNPSTSTVKNPSGVTYSTAGTYNVSLTATNAGGSNTATKTGYITVVNSSTESCDTIGNLPGGTPIVAYTEPTTGIGTISGNNGIGTSEIAEQITAPEAGMTVNAVLIDFFEADYASTNEYVNVHVWDATGAGGAPGNILATQELPISDITSFLGTPTIIPLSSPPTISGTTLYVGVAPYYASGDTISVYTDTFNTATEGTGWTYSPSAGWESYYQLYNTLYGVGGASNAMYAVLCPPAVSPPVANFSATPTTLTIGNSVNFTDLSTNSPTSWSWSFPGATPSTSTAKDPTDIVYSSSGTYNVTLVATNAGGSGSITKTACITVTDPSAACDTISDIPVGTTILAYGSSAGGYFSGNNGSNTTGVAEHFKASSTEVLHSALFLFAVAQYGSPTASITVNVWDTTGTGGSPGKVLATQQLDISDILLASGGYAQYTAVNFSNPPTLSAGENYFIGIVPYYGNGDTVAIYTDTFGNTIPSTGWFAPGGTWQSYYNAFDVDYGSGLSLGITAVACPIVAPVANFSGTPTTVSAGGSVNFTDLSTNSPTGWSWSFPGGTPSSSTVENPTNIVYNSAGTYNVSLTSTNAGGSNSITKTSYITVTGKAPVAAFTASETKACEGSAITFTDQSTNSPTSWSWSFAGGTPSTSSSQDPTITYNTPGTYSVTLTATNNGGSNSSTRTNYITIGAPPSASASVTNVTCNGGDNGAITVTINGGTSPYTYHWNTQATTQNLSDVGQGTYALTITDNVGCTANTGGTVTQPQAIGVSVTTTAATCGQNNGTAVASTTGGTQPFTFAWSNNKSGPSITGLSGGSYTVTATDGNGCSKTAVATVNSTTAPNITLTPSATTCGNNNGSITTSVTGGSGSYTYSWSNGLSSANINGLASGPYSLTVNDGNCSAINSATVGSSAPVSVNTTSRAAACGESNGSATAIPSGGAGYTYYWNNGQTNDSATGISAGNYSVTVTAAGGCTASATASVSNVGGPGVTVSNITDVKCYGNNNGAVTITVSGGNGSYSYNWSNGTTQQNLTGLVANAYNVTVTSNGCISTASAYVTQPPQLNANAIAQDVSCNGGSNGAATAFVSGGVWPYSYNWSNSDVDSTVSGLSPGPYSLTVTDHNNCTDVVNTSVGQPAQLTILVSGTNPGCNTDNGLATATASGGIAPYTYVWSNNSTNSLLTGLAAGVYNVIGTDNNHCTVSGSVTLTAPVSMVLNPVSTPDCNNDNGTATVTITNGTWPYSFHWSNNQSDSVNTNLATGSVTVTVTDAVGCTATSSVNVGTGLALQDTTNNVSCYGGDNGSILLTVSGGSGNYSFSWSNENTTATLTGLASGSYSVTVSDKTNNCQGTGTYSVSQPAQLKDSVATTPTEQNGSTGTASTNTSGGVPPYSFHWSNGEGGSVITGLAAGNYSVTVTDKDSCQSSTDFTISNNSGISDPRDNIGLEIFPNPTDGLINIRLSSLDANTAVEIKVYDVLGNLLMDQSLPNKSRTLATQVSMNDFAAGIYLIQVSQPDWTLNRRIIIQH